MSITVQVWLEIQAIFLTRNEVLRIIDDDDDDLTAKKESRNAPIVEICLYLFYPVLRAAARYFEGVKDN